ncbi:MAG: hypothetical protein R3Y43_04370 [Alphaproteobacteria bacterium]
MNKTKIIAGGTIGLTLLLNANITFADACAVASGCEELGYTETKCIGSHLKCPFDLTKLFCSGATGIFDGNCYENNQLVGVQIGDTNFCISLEEAYYKKPNTKWKNGELYNPDDSSSSWLSDSYKPYGYYNWGYLMGFNKNCYNEDCGNEGFGLSEEQDGSWCKTVMGSNWRAPSCLSGSKDDNCELYSLIYGNVANINSRLASVDSSNTITPSSDPRYWSSSEYGLQGARRMNLSSGSTDDFSIGTKDYHPLYLRCIREF